MNAFNQIGFLHFFLLIFLPLGFYARHLRPHYATLILGGADITEGKFPSWQTMVGKFDFNEVGRPKKTQDSAKPHADRRASSAMRSYRGCSQREIRVLRLFVVGTRLVRDRQAYILRTSYSNAVLLPCAFPALRVRGGASLRMNCKTLWSRGA